MLWFRKWLIFGTVLKIWILFFWAVFIGCIICIHYCAKLDILILLVVFTLVFYISKRHFECLEEKIENEKVKNEAKANKEINKDFDSKDRDYKTDLLKFEYERLTIMILHDSKLAYTIMEIMIPASLLVLSWTIKEYNEIKWYVLPSAFIASVASLIFAYMAERKFNDGNEKRIARLNQIEKELDIWSHRMFTRENIPLGLEREISSVRTTGKYSLYGDVPVHTWFKMYITFFIIAWL